MYNKCFVFIFRSRARERATQLRLLASLARGLDLTSSTHMVTHNHLYNFTPGNPMLSLDIQCVCKYAEKRLIHVK